MKHAAFTRILAFALLVALLSPALPAAYMEEAAGSGILLDFDPEGGFTGDYVLLFNGQIGSSRTLTARFGPQDLQKQLPRLEFQDVATKLFAGRYKRNKAFGQPDPFVPEVQSEPDPTKGYQVGDVRVFAVLDEDSGQLDRIAFQLLEVGQTCRVWSPLNPAFIPLHLIDESYAAQLSAEFDAKYPLVTRLFGEPVGLPGDGKIELLFFDLDNPYESGHFAPCSMFQEVLFKGKRFKSDNLPVIRMDTYGIAGIIQVDEQGNETHDVRRGFTTMVHELQHLLTYSHARDDEDGFTFMDLDEGYARIHEDGSQDFKWLQELCSNAASMMVYPEETLKKWLYLWYAVYESFETLEGALQGKEYVQVSNYNWAPAGASILATAQNLNYTPLVLLSIFLLDRGGEEIFLKARTRYLEEWQEDGFTPFVQILGQDVGLPDSAALFQDFLLALIIRDPVYEEGRYRFFPEGYSPEMDSAAQVFRSLLIPQVANYDVIQLQESGFVIVRPKGGKLVPRKNSDEGITYVGITLKPPVD